jgi:putative ABC transport system substrate-binding protein
LQGTSMRRRDFLGGVGLAALAWPVTALGQQSDRKRLVAVELALDESDRDGKRSVDAFQQELRDLGWTSENLRIEYRWGATTPEGARVHSVELIKLNPDVIVSHATIVTRAVSQGTKKIPIVFTNVSDPIGEKFVESFAKPGGNITGFTNIESTMGAKYLQLLKDVAPSVTRAAMLFNPKSAPGGGSYFTDAFEAAAPQFSIQAIKATVQDAAGIEKAISALASGGGAGLIVVGEPFTNAHRSSILELTSRYRLPTICPYRFYAANGCLLSYGVDLSDQFKRAATYVDRILKGASASSLPVQSPVKFELAINVKTAKALGLTISPTLLARADEVIE